MKKHLLGIAALGLSLFGCGDDVTKTTVVNEMGISQLAQGEEFPKCTEENGGETLYAADSGKAYICTGKSWTPLHGESSADTVVIKDTLVIRDTLLGLNGESCTAEMLEDSRGYKIVCGGDSVGVVLNGINGEKGEDGAAGENGVGCTVADSGNGVVAVQCAADTVKLYKALCGSAPYDPAESFCCDGKTYDLGKSFCGKTLAAGDTVLFYDSVSTASLNQTKLAAGDYGYLLDSRDGRVYRTVTIGSQTWMAQNLNYGYNEGTATSYCYSDDTSNCTKYGRLYTWSAAMDSAAVFSTDGSGCGYGKTCSATKTVRGVCPVGWHLPSYDEWTTLASAVRDLSKLWSTIDPAGSDDYGFSALSAGYRRSNGDFSSGIPDFWSASESGTDLAHDFSLYLGLYAGTIGFHKGAAYSVRCLSDRQAGVKD